MNVLQVTHRYPPRTGGVETHVEAISERLVERGHSVTVFSADAGGAVPRRERRDGVDVRRFRSISRGDATYVAPGIASAVARRHPDVVHTHNFHALPAFFACLGARDGPFVFTTHYHGRSASAVRDLLLRLYRPLGRHCVKRADRVIAVSEWERAQLSDHFGVDTTVIPNGVDTDRYRGVAPEERDRPYLLSVGRLEPYKRIRDVLHALVQLSEYDLLVAGDGPAEDSLRRLAAELGIDDRVEFLGFVETDRLPGLYAGAEALVTLSEFEAYGMTVAEALAAGTPCVVHEAAALVDWVDRPGVIGVEDTDAETVVEAIERTAESERVTWTPPDWDDVTADVERLYEELI